MNILIAFPLFSILGFAFIVANFLKARVTFSIAVATSLVVAALYLADVLGQIYYTSLIMSVLGLFAFIYMPYKQEWLRQRILEYKLEVIFVSIIFIIFFTIYQYSLLWAWDDFSFWSVFSKELFVNNTVFLTKEPLHVLNSHYHYPRGPAYFHYFVMYFSGITESGLLTAHFTLHLLFAMPFFAARYFWQGLTLFMLLFILIMLLPGGNSTVLISIYNDSTIGFIVAAVLAIFIAEKDKYKAIKLVIPIFFMMPIFREIGMLLGMCAALILFILLFYQKSNIEKLSNKFLIFLLLFVLPIISNYLWFWYVDVYASLGRDPHQLNVILGIFNDIVAGDTKSWQIITLYYSRFL